jgi:hypothetical protein
MGMSERKRSTLRLARLPLLAAVCAFVALTVGAEKAHAHFCVETINPAGNPAVGENAVGGDAVPGGTSTSPGTRGNGPINPDGFYLVNGLLFSDNTPIAYPGPGGGFFWPTTAIKYTEWGKDDIKVSSNIGGPKSAIEYHIQAPGDLYLERSKENDGIFCGVPPPPF